MSKTKDMVECSNCGISIQKEMTFCSIQTPYENLYACNEICYNKILANRLGVEVHNELDDDMGFGEYFTEIMNREES